MTAAIDGTAEPAHVAGHQTEASPAEGRVGSLLLAGTERYVAVGAGQLITYRGRLIVATTPQERDALPFTTVALPPEWISVTEWLAQQGVDVAQVARKEVAA